MLTPLAFSTPMTLNLFPPIDIIFPKDTDDPKIFFLTSSPIITTFLPCWISSKVKFLPFANLYPAVII